MKFKKTILPIILGLGYGFLSFWWLFWAIVCAFPSSLPGEKEWAEDSFFIPFGYGMLIVYVILNIIFVVIGRKEKMRILLFYASTLVVGAVTFWVEFGEYIF
ncbi:MAG: hypothetical protein J6B90_04045 [Lachnospiraceae bacterium]|nr:hypothetical protein [Lachnospiraceae bacterium]